jgi:hypothetical protein
MVEQNNQAEEADPISQAQQEVDREQSGSEQAQYLTNDQVQQIMSEQARVYERQIAGLTSKIDTGLNAIRRDTTTSMQQQLANITAKQGMETWLLGLDEEQRALVQPLLARQQQLEEQIQGQAQQPSVEQEQTASPEEGWDTVYKVVRQLGLDPRTKGIDYDVLTAPGLSNEQRQEKFLTSVRTTIIAQSSLQQPRVDSQNGAVQQQASAPQSPPTDGPPRTSATYRNIDDVRDAFISDKINQDEAMRLAGSMGQTL